MKKLLLTSIAALLLATGAVPTQAPEKLLEFAPPPEFDHPYTGKLTVYRVDQTAIEQFCQGNSGNIVLGCAQPEANSCKVWIVNSDVLAQYGRNFEGVLRHEVAHCNNWKHS
jgi:hypothetical protein